MDSYILRIYHRDVQGSRSVVGMLETPDGNARYVFHNVEELWSFLRNDATAGDPPDREQDDASANDSTRPGSAGKGEIA